MERKAKNIMEIIEHEEYDAEDLARELKNTLKQKEELREYEDFLRERLAQLAIDQEGKILVTAYGAFKAEWKPGNLRWDKQRLAQEVYRRAQAGEFSHDKATGEIVGEPEWRVFQAFKEFFDFTPRKTPLKKYDIDIDEFAEKTTEGKWACRIL